MKKLLLLLAASISHWIFSCTPSTPKNVQSKTIFDYFRARPASDYMRFRMVRDEASILTDTIPNSYSPVCWIRNIYAA